jgi:hypothetical protein
MNDMGFTPGDFTTQDGTSYHWEIKHGGRIVLWDKLEAEQILSLSTDDAGKAASQLQLLVDMALAWSGDFSRPQVKRDE